MRTSHSVSLSLAIILFATSVEAITYIVPSDRNLIRGAEAIVVATAISSYPHLTSDGRIVTSIQLSVDRVLKGKLPAGPLELTEIGGQLSDVGLYIPGSPRYESGSRYLIFLGTNRFGELVTVGMGLGRFEFVTDLNGRQLLIRGVETDGVFGLEPDGTSHYERIREQRRFLEFVASEAKSQPASDDYFIETAVARVPAKKASSVHLVPRSNTTRSDYLMAGNPRWVSPTAQFFTYGSQPGFSNGGVDAATNALAQWTGAGAGINYTRGGTTTQHGGLTTKDNVNSILFNDPNGFVASARTSCSTCGNIAAIGGVWTQGSYSLGGENFAEIVEGDVEVGTNLSISESLFAAVLTHELGHTLGFRHSDGTSDPSSPPPACAAPSPCASVGQAIMASTISGVFSLRQWDTDAAQTVYGSGPVCTNPSVVVQPQSQTIAFGAQANLSVTAGGSAPLTYQWYVGTSPDTSSPTPGATSAFFNPSPTTTTNYWVRVSNNCTPPAPVNSQTATVTVQPCQGPVITGEPMDQSVTSGSSAFLSVSFVGSNPVTVSWFRGTEPDMSSPIGTGPGVTTPALTSTTNFWARLQNSCGNVDTRTVTITVAPCQPPMITDDPQDQTVAPGASANLFVGYSGTAGTVTWFLGTFPDSSSTAGSGQFFTTPALGSTTSFWAQVNNSCGSANSRTVTITVSFGCTSPTITTNPANQTVVNGTSVTLAVVASGTGPLHYAWFRGLAGDETKPVGTDSSSFKSAALTTSTQFWVKVTNSCGAANSTAATVNLKPGRARPVKHR